MCEKNDTNYLNQILHFTVYRYCTSCMGGGGGAGGGAGAVLQYWIYLCIPYRP